MKAYEGTEAYKAGYKDAYEKGFNAGREAGEGEWNTMECPPDKEDMYLVAWVPQDRPCVYKHYYELLQWNGSGWDDAIDRKGKEMHVIAWCKLPEFYKEVE